MTADVRFLTVDHVQVVHRRVIAEFGGDGTVRDRGLLEAAVAMPRATYDGARLHTTVPAMAAACLFHICRGHPFVDGNKRTALAAAEVFLHVNAMRLDAPDADVESLTMDVAAGHLDKDDVTGFFTDHCRPDA